ncbi:MAG: glycine cleavage system protein GcvH [Gammaproteobacteria bacterium]|nr:glycine cleavage system protein GcvH [Gammaproteobacteria bacterium]
MSNIPEDLYYTKTHEWVKQDADGTVTVGITDHAQHLLGDMVFIELPDPGSEFNTGDDCAVVESVKAASDVYCPVSGEIIETNVALVETPEVVNQDPYGDGWLFRLKPNDEGEVEDLLDAETYRELAEEESH